MFLYKTAINQRLPKTQSAIVANPQYDFYSTMTDLSHLPEVNISEDGACRYLHLGSQWIQGSMFLKDPLRLDLEYIQRMMAWLLFVEPDSVAERHAMQLGLGAGSLTRFTHKKMGMLTSCIEINPAVYRACRQWFRLPDNNATLNVMLADAQTEIREPQWQGAIDALQVDLYDEQAAAPVLDSLDFYRDCHALLTPDGCMTVNLFGHSSSFERSTSTIAQAFGADAVWAFRPTRPLHNLADHPAEARIMLILSRFA